MLLYEDSYLRFCTKARWNWSKDSKIISWGEHNPHKTGFLWIRLELCIVMVVKVVFLSVYILCAPPALPHLPLPLRQGTPVCGPVLSSEQDTACPRAAPGCCLATGCMYCLPGGSEAANYVSPFFIWGKRGLTSAVFSISRKKIHFWPSLSVKLCLNIKS